MGLERKDTMFEKFRIPTSLQRRINKASSDMGMTKAEIGRAALELWLEQIDLISDATGTIVASRIIQPVVTIKPGERVAQKSKPKPLPQINKNLSNAKKIQRLNEYLAS